MRPPWVEVDAWFIEGFKRSVGEPFFFTSSPTGLGYGTVGLEAAARRFGSLADTMRFLDRHCLKSDFNTINIRPVRQTRC